MTTTPTAAAPEEQPPQQPNPHPRKHIHFSAGFITAVVLLLLIGAAGGWFAGWLRPRPTVALITNNADPFWDPVIGGAQDAAREFGLKLKVVKGTGDADAQSQAVRALLEERVRGLGISPVDAEGQTGVLRQVAVKMPLVTMDSDSPNSSRQWFVGTDNYGAGRQCGSYVRDASPDGGEVLICVGSVTAENGKMRRQGVIDELLDRPYSVIGPFDPLDAPLKGERYSVVGTCVDMHNKERAVQLAVESIKKHPDLKCIVALYSYSTPAVLKALEETGKTGQIKVIGFDVLPETLAAVEAGTVYATMRQAQYDFGFDTVRALSDAINGDPRDVSASTPMRYLGVRAVTKENVGRAAGPAKEQAK